MHFIKKIMSGGQTGVDRAALDVAIELKIPHGGWCPYKRQAEDGYISEKYNLQETIEPTIEESMDPDAVYKKRTELNVRDSEGTLIVIQEDPIGGTLYTLEMIKKYKKNYLIINISKKLNPDDFVNWIIDNNIHILNIAGPRASQSINIYESTFKFLHQFLNQDLLTEEVQPLTEKNILKAKL